MEELVEEVDAIRSAKLISYDQLHKGEQNVPISALCFAIEPERSKCDNRLMTVMTREGQGVILRVCKEHWESWRICRIGQVFSCDVNVSNTSGRLFLTAISGPSIRSTAAIKFKHSILPEEYDTEYKCCIVVVVVAKKDKENGQPTMVQCQTKDKHDVILQSFRPQHVPLLENLRRGQILHVGMVKYGCYKSENDYGDYVLQLTMNLNSCVTVVGNIMSFKKNDALPVATFEELKSKKCGQVIACTGVFLRTVYNGSSFLADVHREKKDEESGLMKYQAVNSYRVSLNNIPKQFSKFKKGDVVDVVAGITGKDIMELQCIEMEKNSEYDTAFDLSDFYDYEPIVIEEGKEEEEVEEMEMPSTPVSKDSKKRNQSQSSIISCDINSEIDADDSQEPAVKKTKE